MPHSKISSVELNSGSQKKSFDIISLVDTAYAERYGYLLVDGFPIVSVSTYYGELEVDGVEKCQIAYDSYIANNGKYNALPLLGDSIQPQLLSFSEDLLEHATTDMFSMFDKGHFYVESTKSSPVPFRFNVWDFELMDLVYKKLVQPKQRGMKLTLRDYCSDLGVRYPA